MANYFNLTIDTAPPGGVTLQINDGANKTSSLTFNLNIGCANTDTAGYQMKIWSSLGGESSANWEGYSPTKAVSFTPESIAGVNPTITFYVKLRDDVWNESDIASASIQYMNSVPAVNIVSNTRSKMSNVNGKNLTRIEFASDMPFNEYKVCIVPTINTSHSGGTILDSATIESPVTELSTVLERDGTDNAFNRLTDGVYIIKIFVKDAVSGNWSV